MTKAEKFLKKFPEPLEKMNCLEDIACLQCGNRDCFDIEVKIVEEVRVTDVDYYRANTAPASVKRTGKVCRCGRCEHSGTLREFTFPGLDRLIHQRRN